MPRFLASAFAAALVLAPAAALAQYVVPEPPIVYQNPPMAMQERSGPLTEIDAAQIAMMHGMAVVRKVDVRMWDGNFKVKGTDMTGEDIVMRIDHDTGQVLEIDD
jgi:hypothetical protein